MCLTVKDSVSEPLLFRTLLELPLPKIDIKRQIICSFISFEEFMPTLTKNIKDYLVSTYELCEDG